MQTPTFGRYHVVKVLGRGGMGVVYEGHDPQIDRPVAIKTIALDAFSDEERAMFEGRFRSEMRSTGRLQHHNIAALYDTGREGGTAYIVMELVSGQDLKRHLTAGRRFSVTETLDITVQLLTALEYAHRRHVVHRDVKPANVILQPDGVIKLCDFGVARLTDSDATRTQGMTVGSLRYASPEQITGLPIDARTDVFSAGVLMYELLTGEPPFKGQSDVEILHRIATQAAPSPRAVNAEVSEEIDGAVQRALAKDPADRFASAADFARALGVSTIALQDTQVAAIAPRAAASVVVAGPGGDTVVTASPSASGFTRPARWAALGGGALVLALGAAWWLRPAAPLPPQATLPSPASAATTTVAVAPAATASSQAPAASPVPASPPITVPAAAPGPAPSPAPVLASASAPSPAPARPADGPWPGQLACGPSQAPGFTGPGSEAFVDPVAVLVNKASLTWTRQTRVVTETVAGSLDARSRFTADGVGSRKDLSADWRVAAKGEFVAKASRLEAQVQLMRKGDGLVTRHCTLVAERGTAATAVAQAPAAVAPPAKAAPATPQGAWMAELACGAAQGASPTATRVDAFVAKFPLEVAGSRVSWLRESKTAYEAVAGSLDAKGRFTAEGKGHAKDDPQRGPWLVTAQGAFDAQDRRMTAKVRLTRSKDGSLLRDCSLTARPA